MSLLGYVARYLYVSSSRLFSNLFHIPRLIDLFFQTVVGARINVRLRVKLMDALLSQDIGFFDITKTGDITSRLSSDTTLVGDQISMNVNVFLRSVVQAVGVLLFMVLSRGN